MQWPLWLKGLTACQQRLFVFPDRKRSFHQDLLSAALADHSSQRLKHQCFDLLLWLAAMFHPSNDTKHLRVKMSQPDSKESKKEKFYPASYDFVGCVLMGNLPQLVRKCVLFADRSIAKKCVKLIVMALQQEKQKGQELPHTFSSKVSRFVTIWTPNKNFSERNVGICNF